MKDFLLLVAASALLLCSCGNQEDKGKEVELSPIMEMALNNGQSRYYADFASFPQNKNKLPIGVFDSGTGGLSVLEVMLKADLVNNITGKTGPDGIPDFSGEDFTYAADQANMPYGPYAVKEKVDFFKELVVKDALFLLGDKYWKNPADKNESGKKLRSKIIVMACNTATAWGMEDVSTLLEQSGTGIRVVGVINAGVKALMDKIMESNPGATRKDTVAVGVLGTDGTIASGAYGRLIGQMKENRGFEGAVSVVSQSCSGLAEAIDGDRDYADPALTEPRASYRGPVLGGESHNIQAGLLDAYNFQYGNGAILREKSHGQYVSFQLNSAENYVRFHLVSLLEKHRRSGSSVPMKYVVLGCTHYPYMMDVLLQVLNELRNYRDEHGAYVYASFISPDFEFIDPAVYTALETYRLLREDRNLALNTDDGTLDAYISVPAYGLAPGSTDAEGHLTYEYKYGREYGSEDVSTVFVPISRRYIDAATLSRIERMMPASYSRIQQIIE